VSELERRESEPLPVWQSIEVVALRRNTNETAAELRQSLPIMLAGIFAEVEGAELQLGMLSDDDGMVGVELAAWAGDATTAVVAELAAALEQVAETATHVEQEAPATVEWPVVADRPRGQLGFGNETTCQTPQVLPLPTPEDAPACQVIEELAAAPGQGLRVRLRTTQQGARPTWEAQLSVATTGAEPSLRLRAEIRRRFGLRVADSTEEAPARLKVETEQLPAILCLPIAGSAPLPGAYTAAAAPIPMTRPRSASCPEPGLRIGYALTGGGRPLPVELSAVERLRHVHVLGQTGTGKSSALAGIVGELANRGDGALIADPHGQLCDRILAELPDDARDRVWVIRCGDVENPVPINPLAETDPVRRDIAIADLCGTFQYLFDRKETGIVGPRFIERVAMTLRALAAAHGTRTSLLDVPFASADDAFMENAIARSNDDRLKSWWRTNKLERNSNEHGQVLAWVNSKFESFSSTAAMRGILGSGADAIDFADAMDDGRIILLDLSKAQLGEAASRLLGFIYLNRVWNAALRRRRPDRPFTVIVDEAHTLIAGALTNMLSEGRKFGLSVMLAHQYLDQLDADLRPAVEGNVATTIAFRCAVGDAGELYKRFGGLVDTSVLVTLPELSAVTLRTATSGPAHPHTVIVDHNDRIHTRRGAELDEHVGSLLQSTYTALVDPHRDITVAAANGASNVKTMPARKKMPSPPEPRPATGAKARATCTADGAASTRTKASFLNQWLAERAEVAGATDADNPADGGGIGVITDTTTEGSDDDHD
jgi:hypothetical protein